MMLAHALALGAGGRVPTLALPPGFDFPAAFMPAIRKSGSTYTASINERGMVNAAIWTATPYYVDPTKADNTGNGLSWATAKRDINAAITAANADAQTASLIYCLANDNYHQTRTINGTSGTTGAEPTKPCAFVASGGRVRHWAGTTETFPASKDPTFTNSYVGGPSSAVRVFDRLSLTANGDYTELTNAADAATVDSTLNSWCVSSATGSNKVHIRRSDGLQPTVTNTLILRNLNVAAFDTCTTDLYFEGFDFEGGQFGALWCDPIATRNVVAVDCTFKYAGNATNMLDGLRVRRTQGLALMVRCTASANAKDGFNYHVDDASSAQYVVQIDCRGYDNGRYTSTSNNGFTTHDTVTAIDVNGEFFANRDGADLHNIENTKTWCVGTEVRATAAGGADPTAFKASNNAVMWLEGTRAESTGKALYAQAAAGTIYKRNHTTASGTETADVGATITTF